jgi:hypothetical protein
MANAIPTKTSLKKGDNLPPRGKGKKSMMLAAIREVCGSEQEFLAHVVKAGIGDMHNDIAPNPTLLTLALNRIEPPLKAIAPMVEFDFDPKAKPHEQASQILKAVSNSYIAPDIGQMFIASIKSMIDIEEYTDLKNRIEKLEKVLAGEA